MSGAAVQGCYRQSLLKSVVSCFPIVYTCLVHFLFLIPQRWDVQSCSFPKSFWESCCRSQELVPDLTLLSTHQVLIRCLLQEHPNRSLSLMSSMARLSPVKPAEYFVPIWSIPLAAVTLLGLHSRWCFSPQPGLTYSPVLGASSGKDDVSLNFPGWRRDNFPPIFAWELRSAGSRVRSKQQFYGKDLAALRSAGAPAPGFRLLVHMVLYEYALESHSVWHLSFPLDFY